MDAVAARHGRAGTEATEPSTQGRSHPSSVLLTSLTHTDVPPANERFRSDHIFLGPNELGTGFRYRIRYRTARPANTPVRTIFFKDFIVRWTWAGGDLGNMVAPPLWPGGHTVLCVVYD